MVVWVLRSRKDRLLLTEDYFDTVLALTVPGDLINVSKDSGGHFPRYWGGGGGARNFQHVCIWCRFKICEFFQI